ncbi:MAG: hemolysin III family protein [Deltaproteobacteria bacterium]|nr:hemolysin III family protein [Deltaproteobacteria bacterium]
MSTTSPAEPAAKPLMRGVLHQGGALVALGAGIVMVATAPTTRAAWAAAGFAASLVSLYTVSAVYHRVNWSPIARARMRRADHASIFVLIAGTYTPLALLGLRSDDGDLLLLGVWIGALVGVLKSLFWINAPKIVAPILCVALGWAVVPYWSEAQTGLGTEALAFVFAGGVVYTIGALCYATKRPTLKPSVFGYHECFHACTLIAAVLHFIAVLMVVQRAS